MQRVSLLLPAWDRARSADGKSNGNNNAGSSALSRVFGWTDKTAINRRSASASAAAASATTASAHPAQSKFGRETYWPSSLEKECEKAARILKSFCADGFLSYEPCAELDPVSPMQATPATSTSDRASSSTQTQIMKKVPPRIVQNAVGLAIFSCVRSGLWMSGSGGSGILIARKADGTWSPPSGILLHTADLGFIIGVDIYDCVLVINSVAALEMFARSRVVLGADVPLTVGPVAPVGVVENDQARWRGLDNTVLTYLKARGQHRAVQLDGSLVTERGNENEKFYGTSVEVLDILAGNVRKSIPEIAPLFEAIKAAEGRTDFDVGLMQALAEQPAPGDATIETPIVTPVSPTRSTFGLPSSDDPDPFGVIALEMAGLEIREAGSRHRPTSAQLDYVPSPTSPFFGNLNRQSVDTYLSHSNRGSYMSSRTQATTMTDAYTQTDVGETARTSPCPTQSGEAEHRSSPETLPVVTEPKEIDYTKIDLSPLEGLNRQSLDAIPVVSAVPGSSRVSVLPEHQAPPFTPQVQEARPEELDTGFATDVGAPSDPFSEDDQERDGDADDEDDEDDEEEEPVIFEVATAAQPARAAIMATQVTQVISAKGALVTIPKRIPPALPARNPARSSRVSRSEYNGDVSGLQSPARPSFESSVKDAEEYRPAVASEARESEARESVEEPNTTPTKGQDEDGLGPTTPIPARSHRRNPSILAAAQGMPATLMTPTHLEPSSSADEESVREPQTPRLGDDIGPKQATYDDCEPGQDATGTQNDLNMKPSNFSTATIEVV